jgi:hypothetical protein
MPEVSISSSEWGKDVKEALDGLEKVWRECWDFLGKAIIYVEASRRSQWPNIPPETMGLLRQARFVSCSLREFFSSNQPN